MQKGKFTPDLIAWCGMNCGICKRYLAYSNGVPEERGKLTHCRGCLLEKARANCYIKKGCKNKAKDCLRFCFECDKMPCENMKHLDKRYRENYCMSMVENLNEIKGKGVENFLESQGCKYRCSECGDVFSVHDGKCYKCGHISKERNS